MVMKLFFAADVHNSELAFRRFLSVPKLYDVDVLILSGDLTGKSIVPIVEREDGSYECRFRGKVLRADSGEKLEEIKAELLNRGIYPYVCTRQEVEELKNRPDMVDRLFQKLIVDRIRDWVEKLEEHIPADRLVFLTPGNDDIFEIDEPIKGSGRGLYPLGRLVELENGYAMLSFDYSNPTPWNTPREDSEKGLWKRLEKLADLVDRDWRKIICNFHVPPYGTSIDLAPKLDKNLRPVYRFGEPELVNVGSRSVRRFLEEYKPLVGLHGHIHESAGYDKVGETIVFNPGSEYTAGILKGLLLEFDEDGLRKWARLG